MIDDVLHDADAVSDIGFHDQVHQDGGDEPGKDHQELRGWLQFEAWSHHFVGDKEHHRQLDRDHKERSQENPVVLGLSHIDRLKIPFFGICELFGVDQSSESQRVNIVVDLVLPLLEIIHLTAMRVTLSLILILRASKEPFHHDLIDSREILELSLTALLASAALTDGASPDCGGFQVMNQRKANSLLKVLLIDFELEIDELEAEHEHV